MNLNLIKILSFFIGLFITLLFISYYKIYEPFSVSSQLTELSEKIAKPLSNPLSLLSELSSMVKQISDDDDDDSMIPYRGYKFMCINTYNDIKKISISDGKWYDVDSDNKHYDFNYNNYFKFNTIINFEKNRLNNKTGADGANIYKKELEGPSCYNFANNSETYELEEFTMFITANMIACSKTNNILFEMTGNTITTDKIIPTYTTSIININLIINKNKNYDIHLTIGNKIYKGQANNIDRTIIEDSDYITIGLFYTKEKLGLILNSKIYEYSNINEFPITLGSTPLIINKYGSINMHLYNFIYYKNLYDFNNYEYLVRYNNYYISGLNSSKCSIPEITTISKDPINFKPIKFDKIKLPIFRYPILHDEETENDDEDKNKDNLNKKYHNHHHHHDHDNKDDKDDKDDNKNDNKDDDYIYEDNNKIRFNIDQDDEYKKPDLLDRVFGFFN
jgi:hypothetical protein